MFGSASSRGGSLPVLQRLFAEPQRAQNGSQEASLPVNEAAQSPVAAHHRLQSAIEVPSQSSHLEWQVSQLLASHQTSVEALLVDHHRRTSAATESRIQTLKEDIGFLSGKITGAKALQDARQELLQARQETRDVQREDASVKALMERFASHEERVVSMQKQILRVLVEVMDTTNSVKREVQSEAQASDSMAGEMAQPPVVLRFHSEVAKMHEDLHEKYDKLHERLHEKHEQLNERVHERHVAVLSSLHDQHVAMLKEMAEQVTDLTCRATGRVNLPPFKWGGERWRPNGGVAFEDEVPTEWGNQAAGPQVTGSAEDSPRPRHPLSRGGVSGHVSESSDRQFRGMEAIKSTRAKPRDLSIDVQALQDVQGWRRDKRPVRDRLRRFRHMLESVSSVLIVLNILYMGIETEFSMLYAQKGQSSPVWLWYGSLCFCLAFSLELLVRLALERWDFFTGHHWRWNAFDAVLVIVQIVDVTFAVVNLSFIRALRCMRSLRALRVIKTVAYVRELRLMIASIGASLSSLLWAFVLLLLVLYLFSLALEQTIQAHIEMAGVSALHPKLLKYYGSLGSAMVTLFMSISGGMDWSDLVDPLLQISKAYILFFMCFITFVLFGMLNILTAVFVEATNRIAEVDQDLVIQEHLDHEDSVISKVREFLRLADIDGSGTISKTEFEVKLNDPYFQAQLNLLDLDGYEAQGVFKILNIHETEEVEIEELIYGLMRLKGNAKAVDVVTMLCESRRIARRLVAFMRYTEDNFTDLRQDLGLSLHEQHVHMSAYMTQSKSHRMDRSQSKTSSQLSRR